MPFRHLDLFSGIGGFALAARRTGFETIQFCEIDGFCQAVLQKNFPGVLIHDDITTFDARPFDGTVDLITGGFPCQDISAAGKGAGLIEGKRSSLWFELLRVIVEVRPAVCLIENVPALRTRGADRVLQDLAEAGYTAEAFVVGADDVGASHRRKRVWIVAYRDDAQPVSGGEPVFAGRGERRGSEPGSEELRSSQCDCQAMADAEGKRPGEARELRCDEQAERTACRRSIFPPGPGEELAYSERLRRAAEAQRESDTETNGDREDNQLGDAGYNLPDWPPGPGGDWSNIPTEFWPIEPRVRVLADGIPSGLVRRGRSPRNAILKGLGNAIVPQVAEPFLQWIKLYLDEKGGPTDAP